MPDPRRRYTQFWLAAAANWVNSDPDSGGYDESGVIAYSGLTYPVCYGPLYRSDEFTVAFSWARAAAVGITPGVNTLGNFAEKFLTFTRSSDFTIHRRGFKVPIRITYDLVTRDWAAIILSSVPQSITLDVATDSAGPFAFTAPATDSFITGENWKVEAYSY